MKQCNFATRLLVFLTLLTVSSHAYTQSPCYSSPPSTLALDVERVTRDIVTNRDADFLGSNFEEMVAFTIADAYTGTISFNIRDLEAYRYLGETARTDKQVGASAKSSGSTSAIEKPGLIDLLGFAIERGAIQQQINDTTLTLSTSPYALIAAAKGDTDKTYRDYDLFARLGVSATFNLTNQDNVLLNASRKQLTEWSARLRLSGDRSTRSTKFQEFWDREIAPLRDQRLTVQGTVNRIVLNDPAIKGLTDLSPTSLYTTLKAQISAYFTSHPTGTADQQLAATAAIKEMILCALKSSVYDKIKSGELNMIPGNLTALGNSLTNLQAAHARLAEAQVRLAAFLESFMKEGNLSTFAYTNHRVAEGSDYSEMKLLFERHVKPLDVVLNAGLSLYNKPDKLKNQERIRDFSAAILLEGSSRSPFRSVSDDLSKITYSLTGHYERLKENEGMSGRDPDIAGLQFRVEVPIALGLSVPIAYSYASATETSPKKENKFNIGLHLDMDKLFALARSKNK
jgi:hypothetical protein